MSTYILQLPQFINQLFFFQIIAKIKNKMI